MIQIDIPMPKTCYDCPCHDGEYGRCQITGNSYCDEIPRSCPCREIPSTQQERKKGKWIEVEDFYNRISGRCSVCGWESHMYEDDVVGMDYCPNCGARLVEKGEDV